MHLMLYDGACGLCHRAVRFVLARDRSGVFRFAQLQGELAARALAPHGEKPSALDTFWLIADYGAPAERAIGRGRGATAVLKALPWPWSWIGTVGGLVPRPILDRGYDFVARHRERWFGRDPSCPLPDPSRADRFLNGPGRPGG